MRKTRLLLISAVALALAVYFVTQQRRRPPELLDQVTAIHPVAPGFSLTDIKGQQLTLAAYAGRVVVLDFWATWCAPCKTEIPGFVGLQNRYADRGLQVIGIALDENANSVREFHQEFKMNYPVALGDANLAERYGGILGLPVTFVIGCDGRIYAKHAGETATSVIEQEIQPLLIASECRSKH